MKPFYILILLSFIALTNINLSCHHCYGPYVPVSVSSQALTHLDNRGIMPRVLHPGEQGWREAYGFRLSAFSEIQNPLDTVDVECPEYQTNPYPTGLAIVTRTGMGPDYPAGADVTTFFKNVAFNGRYFEVYAGRVGVTWSYPGVSFLDFLLVRPPAAPGWQQFEVLFQQSDSTAFSIVTDSIYLQ